MKITYRIPHPKDQYAFVEVIEDFEGLGPEDVRSVYDSYKAAFEDGQGIGMKHFANVVHEYCTTEAIVNGGEHDFSTNEKLLLGELKKLIRAKNK